MAFAAHESARTLRAVRLDEPLGYAPLEVVQHPPKTATTGESFGRAVLLADEHHLDARTGRSGRDGLVEALRGMCDAVHFVPAEQRELTDADLAGADLLVMYHTRRTSSDTTRQRIGDWVAAGRPLIVCHCAIGAYPDWPQFREWIGLHWVWANEDKTRASHHPMSSYEILVTGPNRFDVAWPQAWLPRDEMYMNLGSAAPVDILAVARTGEAEVPVAWQSRAAANVAVWTPGHRPDMWRLPPLIDGLRATIRLAASRTR